MYVLFKVSKFLNVSMNFFNVRRLVHNYIRQDTLMKIIEFLLENRFSNQNKNQSRFKVDKASNVNKKQI